VAGVHSFSADLINGAEISLSGFEGQVLLIVNVASRCGFTPQYAGLEKLQRDLGPRGFSVLGFPCNQFGAQEPGNAGEIVAFCSLTYEVTFPLFAKIEVNGRKAHPLYQYLKAERRGIFGTRRIKWNFTKFLVDRDGRVVARFGPATTPQALRKAIEKLL